IKELISKFYEESKNIFKDKLTNMERVLRRLDFTKDDVVLQKGQIACNISSADELLLTQMLFDGSLNDVSPEYLAACLTCFLSNENKSSEDDGIQKDPKLKELYQRIRKEAQEIENVLIECKLQDENQKQKYSETIMPDYMMSLLLWAKGEKFNDVILSHYEGNVIRIMRRLDELFKQLAECASLLNNYILKDNLVKAAQLIRRGLPFNASLYLVE
ncbi:MAG: hypothetical protein MJ252_07135, partial [archaeon]|nr:hypothetical protein [archaeon]